MNGGLVQEAAVPAVEDGHCQSLELSFHFLHSAEITSALTSTWPLIARPPNSDEAFGGEFRPKNRVGRDEQLMHIWNVLSTGNECANSKSTAFYMHASPGMGKTFLLRELVSRAGLPSNLVEQATDVVILVVDFGRSSCKEIANVGPNIEHANVSFVPLMRLFYIQFIDQANLSWSEFFREVWNQIVRNDFTSDDIVDWISLQLRTIYDGKRKVVIVDEISKAECLWKNAADVFRCAICTWCDGGGRIANVALFSCLDRLLMRREVSLSSRPMKSITTLPLLSIEESLQYVDENISCGGFQDGHGIVQDRADAIRFLAVGGGGHPRSLLTIIESCVGRLHAGLPTNVDAIVFSAGNILSSAYNFPLFWLRLVLAAIIAQPVKLTDVLLAGNPPDIVSETYESLINRGLLVASLDTYSHEVIPVIPEIFLHWWSRNRPDEHSKIKAHLHQILTMRARFSAGQCEVLHGNWECLVRLLRGEEGSGTCQKLSLLERYNMSEATVASKTEVFKIPTDQNTELVPVSYERNTKLVLTPNTIVYYPLSDDVQEGGWDVLIVLEAFPQKKVFPWSSKKCVLPLFIQNNNRYNNKKDAGTKIHEDQDVVDVVCVMNCVSFMQNYTVVPSGYSLLTNRKLPYFTTSTVDKFVVMPLMPLVANTEHASKGVSKKSPPAGNIFPLFRQHLLPALYGPIMPAYLEKHRSDTTLHAVPP